MALFQRKTNTTEVDDHVAEWNEADAAINAIHRETARAIGALEAAADALPVADAAHAAACAARLAALARDDDNAVAAANATVTATAAALADARDRAQALHAATLPDGDKLGRLNTRRQAALQRLFVALAAQALARLDGDARAALADYIALSRATGSPWQSELMNTVGLAIGVDTAKRANGVARAAGARLPVAD